MNEKHTTYLYKKYPKIFTQRKLSIRGSAMPWGFECGDGWFTLIDILCTCIQMYMSRHRGMEVKAVQVKEKFGGLRFYIDGGDDKVDNLIEIADSLSYKICEECGSMDRVTQTKGWISTRCKKCHTKRIKEEMIK